MHPDDDPKLKAGFAELHRHQREQAPSFSPMRERAMRQPAERAELSLPAWSAQRLGWAAAACAAALMAWWGLEISRRDTARPSEAASTERVEDLIAAIERHMAASEPALDVEYPTDLLLIENQTALTP